MSEETAAVETAAAGAAPVETAAAAAAAPIETAAVAPEARVEAMIAAVERVQALPGLSAGAKAVLIRLTLRHPGAAVRNRCPPPVEMAPWLGLSERSVRRAYAELEDAGYIAAEEAGAGAPAGGWSRDIWERERWFYDAEAPAMSLQEHVGHLEWLRDMAVTRGRIGVALSAEKAAGRALGYQGRAGGGQRRHAEVANFDRAPVFDAPIPPQPAAPPVWDAAPCPAVEPVAEAAPRSGPETGPEAGPETRPETGPALAETGAAPAETGTERDGIGANWQELAGLDPRSGPFHPKYLNEYKALMKGDPASPGG